jgi:hypothetical protein
VTQFTQDDLADYLVRFVEWAERLAIIFIDDDPLVLGQEGDGALVIDLGARLPARPRAQPAEMEVFERWRPLARQGLVRVEYMFELRHHEMSYRRALHHHDEEHFVRRCGVVTHEHCEATMGVEACGHYFGYPVRDAFDAVTRLYDVWMSGAKPDCSALRCLEV